MSHVLGTEDEWFISKGGVSVFGMIEGEGTQRTKRIQLAQCFQPLQQMCTMFLFPTLDAEHLTELPKHTSLQQGIKDKVFEKLTGDDVGVADCVPP